MLKNLIILCKKKIQLKRHFIQQNFFFIIINYIKKNKKFKIHFEKRENEKVILTLFLANESNEISKIS